MSDNLKDRLNMAGVAALDWLTRQLVVLDELVFVNRRMTAKGAAIAVAFLAAHFGLQMSEAAQTILATGIFLYLGIAGRDKTNRSF